MLTKCSVRLILHHKPHPPVMFRHGAQLLALGSFDDEVVLDELRTHEALQLLVGFDGAETLSEGLGELGGDA